MKSRGTVAALSWLAAGQATAAPAPQPEPLAPAMLRIHNATRAALGVAPLDWDDRLAADAEAYARVLAAHGALTHSDVPEGENLFMGTRGAFSFAAMAGAWAAEGRLFRRGRFPDIAASGGWEELGHYTQMIWAGTTKVGCGVAAAARWEVLVCRYDPAGNVIGEDPLAPAATRLQTAARADNEAFDGTDVQP
jgi:hypothetical protein